MDTRIARSYLVGAAVGGAIVDDENMSKRYVLGDQGPDAIQHPIAAIEIDDHRTDVADIWRFDQ
jgi:hypothetical protein